MVAEVKEEMRSDIYEQNGTLFKITGFKNGNAYPMSIRTARWALTIVPGAYVSDRNGKKVTDKKLMAYVGAGQLSVDREVLKSADNFRADSEKPVSIDEAAGIGSNKAAEEPTVDKAGTEPKLDGPATSSDEKKSGGLKFGKMKDK